MFSRAEQLEARRVTINEEVHGVGWHEITTAEAAGLRQRIADLDALIDAK